MVLLYLTFAFSGIVDVVMVNSRSVPSPKFTFTVLGVSGDAPRIPRYRGMFPVEFVDMLTARSSLPKSAADFTANTLVLRGYASNVGFAYCM